MQKTRFNKAVIALSRVIPVTQHAPKDMSILEDLASVPMTSAVMVCSSQCRSHSKATPTVDINLFSNVILVCMSFLSYCGYYLSTQGINRAVLGPPWACLCPSWACLGSSWASLGPFWARRGLSRLVLGLSSAKMAAKVGCPGEGGGNSDFKWFGTPKMEPKTVIVMFFGVSF